MLGRAWHVVPSKHVNDAHQSVRFDNLSLHGIFGNALMINLENNGDELSTTTLLFTDVFIAR